MKFVANLVNLAVISGIIGAGIAIGVNIGDRVYYGVIEQKLDNLKKDHEETTEE